MALQQMLIAWIFVTVVPYTMADFTPHFRKFLHDSYGVNMAGMLERTDLGLDASLGGMQGPNDQPTKQAIILVHGITNKITRFMPMVHFLYSKGYKSSEVYGTTWGDAGTTPIGLVDMKCSYVKQIRSLIIAVRQYTGTQVDVIAYSMGSPIARKAILGGQCVDTREILGSSYSRVNIVSGPAHPLIGGGGAFFGATYELSNCTRRKKTGTVQKSYKAIGPPLTELIDTFLSVAGANYGSALCVVPIPVGTCNRRTGLHCESAFLQDINNQARYEGSFVYSIFSTADEKVGFRTCGKPVAPIRGGTGYVKKDGLSHDQLMDSTHFLQMNFVSKHAPK